MTALNISQRGLLVDSPWSLSKDLVVHLAFTLDGVDLQVVGRVVWAQATTEGRTRHGIEFVSFYDDAMDRIIAFAPARASASADTALAPTSMA